MPILLQSGDTHRGYGVWKIDETEAELLKLLPLQQQEDCRAQSQTFTSAERRLEWLAVRVLLCGLLRSSYHIDYLPSGKPYLKDDVRKLSISHTRGFVAVAYNDLHPVGIDIERWRERVLRVYPRFMNNAEMETWDDRQRLARLLLCWSAKEAMYKCQDNPTADLRQFHVRPFDLQTRGSLAGCFLPAETSFAIDYLLTEDFVLTLVKPAL